MLEARELRGIRPQALPRPNRTYAPTRVCSSDGCGTRLSVYNADAFCWAHTAVRFPGVRGDRTRTSAA